MDPDAPPQSVVAFLFAQDLTSLSVDPSLILIEVAVFLLLLVASALFSGSEVALFSLDSAAKQGLAQARDKASGRVLRLLETPRQLLITILILNTFVNVAASILAAVMTVQLAQAAGFDEHVVVLVEVLVLTFVLLVVSEITPKLIAARHAVPFARRASGLLLALQRLLFPLSNLLARTTQVFQNRFRPALQRLSSDDLKAMAEIGEAAGTLEEAERELIHSIVEFGETAVREVMVSRVDVVAVPATAALPEVLAIVRESGHSRLPLFIEHLDNILGILYAKDLLPYLHQPSAPLDLTRLARPPMFVPMGKKLDDLLKDFQTRKTHIAIVVDEYGGTAGLVTLEDVLEEIVGDIRDEHDDPDEALYQQLDPDTYRFDARIDLDELNDIADLELDTESFDFETLGGLIFHVAGAIPEVGQEVCFGPLHMKVESITHHRIGQVLVRIDRVEEATEANGEG